VIDLERVREAQNERAARERAAADYGRYGRDTPIAIDPSILPEGVVHGTDLAAAHLLVDQHGRDLRYCGELGWLAWDARRWAGDDTAERRRRMHCVGRSIELYAAQLLEDAARATSKTEAEELRAQAQKYARWARQTQTDSGIAHALSVAEALVPLRAAALDLAPMLVTTRSGTLDLRADGNELRDFRREDLITRLTGCAYDPHAAAPAWEAFVERVLPDAEVRAFVQRALGYSLTGDTSEQIMFIAHGVGANGKSSLLETVRHVMGDYATHVQTDTLMAIGRPRGADNDLMRLRSARFVTAIESGEGKRLDEPRIKSLTGGDTVTARLLYHEPIEFRPTAKLWLATNHRPEVTGTDHAIWRRLRLIPFEVTIPEAERDPELQAKLRAESDGILAWMVRGCLDWQQGGLRAPEAVMAATESWRADSDELMRFIVDRCEVLEGVRTRSGDLYAAYTTWARAEGNREPLSSQAFGRRVTEAGFAEQRAKDARYRRGIGLRETTEGER
jgi:putative DNA primase/helicase